MQRGKCKSCRADVLWVRVLSGKTMPLDPDPVDGGNVYRSVDDDLWRVASKLAPAPRDQPTYRSHFATCPNSQHHRK